MATKPSARTVFARTLGESVASPVPVTPTPQDGPQRSFVESDADIVVYGGAAGGGKALKLDTLLPTPRGWTTMGEVREGDVLFDDRGAPCSVIRCTGIMLGNPCYEVEFSDGSIVVADGDHLWVTMTDQERMSALRSSSAWREQRRAKRPRRGTGARPDLAERNALRARSVSLVSAGSVRTTREIAETLRIRGSRSNHSVRVSGPLVTPRADLPIEPYTLGAWLGDGTGVRGSITSDDPEIIDQLRLVGFEVRHIPSSIREYSVVGLTNALRRAGVLANKHVPPAYLRAGIDQRLALLQGLMDTDGYADSRGQCEFTTTDRRLADDVLELVLSLGIKAASREGPASLNGRDCGPKWRIKFLTPLPAFRLTRKLERQKRCGFRPTVGLRSIVDVRSIPSVAVRCIEVDSPSRCYLAGRAMIPTHNTWGLLMTPILKGHIDNPGFGAVIFRRTYPDITAEGGMWDESEALYHPFGAVSRQKPLERRFPSGAKVRFAHMQHVKDRLRSKGWQITYIAFDQLEEFEAAQFWYLLSRNRSTCGVTPYVRATVNPDPDSWVKDLLAPWVDDRHPEFPFPPGELRYFARDGDSLVWVDADWRDPDGQPATSLTYIPATIYDNPALLASNPQYLTRLRSLPQVDRARLLDGDWNMRYEGNLFKREWFRIVDQAPARLESVGRSWDLAGTVERSGADPDWTVGAKVGYLAGVWYVLDIVRVRASPAGVDKLMDQTAALDGRGVEIHLQQDPGEAGKREVEGHMRRLKGYVVRWRRPTGDKVTRAKPLASAAEAGNVVLVSGLWNRDFINECVAFPGRGHDDQVDAVSWEMLIQAFPDETRSYAPIPVGSGPGDWIMSASMENLYDDLGGAYGEYRSSGGEYGWDDGEPRSDRGEYRRRGRGSEHSDDSDDEDDWDDGTDFGGSLISGGS